MKSVTFSFEFLFKEIENKRIAIVSKKGPHDWK